jgi:hypothetical protein
MAMFKNRPFDLVVSGLLLLIFSNFEPSCAVDRTNERPPAATAKTYYVATDGDNAYNGLQPIHQGGSDGPFQTLDRAANAVKAGDSVLIRGGTYTEVSAWTASGSEASPITITNYNGERVVVDGNHHKIPSGTYGVLLQVSGDWYAISNLEIRYSSWYGLLVSGAHCVINNVTALHNWGSGITMTGSYGLIQDCRAYNNSLQNEYFQPHSPGTWSSGIAVCRTPSYVTVRNCTAWDNWGQGIDVYECFHVTVEDCVAYNNQQNFYVSDAQHILLQRNLSYFTPGNMIQDYETQNSILMGDERFNPPSSDNTVINNLCLGGERNISIGRDVFENGLVANNTFVNASGTAGPESMNVRVGAGAYKNARFLNNIVLQDDSFELCQLEATGVTFGSNNWSRKPESACQGAGDIAGDPRLARTGPVGAGSLDPDWFKIGEGSPAQDRAKALVEVIEDFFGTPRGNTPDIGAYEIPLSLGMSTGPRMSWAGASFGLRQLAEPGFRAPGETSVPGRNRRR